MFPTVFGVPSKETEIYVQTTEAKLSLAGGALIMLVSLIGLALGAGTSPQWLIHGVNPLWAFALIGAALLFEGVMITRSLRTTR